MTLSRVPPYVFSVQPTTSTKPSKAKSHNSRQGSATSRNGNQQQMPGHIHTPYEGGMAAGIQSVDPMIGLTKPGPIMFYSECDLCAHATRNMVNMAERCHTWRLLYEGGCDNCRATKPQRRPRHPAWVHVPYTFLLHYLLETIGLALRIPFILSLSLYLTFNPSPTLSAPKTTLSNISHTTLALSALSLPPVILTGLLDLYTHYSSHHYFTILQRILNETTLNNGLASLFKRNHSTYGPNHADYGILMQNPRIFGCILHASIGILLFLHAIFMLTYRCLTWSEDGGGYMSFGSVIAGINALVCLVGLMGMTWLGRTLAFGYRVGITRGVKGKKTDKVWAMKNRKMEGKGRKILGLNLKEGRGYVDWTARNRDEQCTCDFA